MGQSSSSSSEECPKTIKESCPPSFAEVMRAKADKANQEKHEAFVALLREHLTPEAMAKDVQDCIEVVIKHLDAQTGKGAKEYQKHFPSALFCAVWAMSKDLLTSEGYSLFRSMMTQHVDQICAEFARRTRMPISATKRPGFVIEKDYRTAQIVRVSDVAHFSFQVKL